MYVAITPQKLGNTFQASVGDYVTYLEKENVDKHPELEEHFFDQYNDKVSPEKVISEIDGNTTKLKKTEPKFYSIMVSPNQRELKAINNDPYLLRKYTRELMKDYANSFYRDKQVSIDDIKYYAKIEHERTYRGFEKKILENALYHKKIIKLQNDIRKVERGELKGRVKDLEKQIKKLKEQAPHKINGEMLSAGMKKPGFQTHVHIIVSRKDISNTYSLSPGSRYRTSEAELNGKLVKRGFDRDAFFENAEKTYDRVSGFNRNYVETYRAKKAFVKDPKLFYAKLLGLPTNQRALAFKILRKTGLKIPSIPTNKVQLAIKTFKKLKKGLEIASRSSSIGT